jgi:hypothetical protein
MIPYEHGESCPQERDHVKAAVPFFERRTRHGKKLGVPFVISMAAITPAVAQDAKSLLEIADKRWAQAP